MDHQEQNSIKTDIFRAYDIRGIYPNDFNESAAYFIGVALGNRIQGQKKAVDEYMSKNKISPFLFEVDYSCRIFVKN